jgi:hypothetical protein
MPDALEEALDQLIAYSEGFLINNAPQLSEQFWGWTGIGATPLPPAAFTSADRQMLREHSDAWYTAAQGSLARPADPELTPTITVTGIGGVPVQVQISEPVERGATIQAIEQVGINDPNFEQAVLGNLRVALDRIFGGPPVPSGTPARAGPYQFPEGDIRKPVEEANKEEDLNVSFIGDLFQKIGSRVLPGLIDAPMMTMPTVYAAGRAAVTAGSRLLGPVGAAVGVGTMAYSAYQAFSGGNGHSSPMGDILAQARGNVRGATRKKIYQAARHCGLDVAAQTYGLDPMQVCQVVAAGYPRRARGVSAADIRRARGTLRKIRSFDKALCKGRKR